MYYTNFIRLQISPLSHHLDLAFSTKKIHKHTSTLALLIVFNLSVIYETLFQLCFSLYTLGIDTLTRLNNEYPVIDLLQLPKSQDNG